MKYFIFSLFGASALTGCMETASPAVAPSVQQTAAAQPNAVEMVSDENVVNPDTALLQVFGRPAIWCPAERFSRQVAAQLTNAKIQAGVSVEAVKAIVAGCGTTTDLGMLTLQNGEPELVGSTATADGGQIPMFSGPGGRVIF